MILAAGAFAADEYAVDPVHSHVGFSVTHMVIAKIRGEFTTFSGTFLYDDKDVTKSSVKGKIGVSSITTANDQRDTHLKSPDFFDAKTYPDITFESKKITPSGDGYQVTGALAMHGVTKEIAFPFKITGKVKDPWGNERIGIEAVLTLNRQDYGVSWSKTLDSGGLVAGNEVQIDLSGEFIKQVNKK